MKKWIKYILASVWLIAVFSAFSVSAKDSGTAYLEQIEGSNNVKVILELTEGKTEKITSLRVQLFVSVDHGELNEPAFAFDPSLMSSIQDAAVNWDTDAGDYIIDIILSGKQNELIFDEENGRAVIGTVMLDEGDAYYAEVGLVAAEDVTESVPVLQYAESAGMQAMTIHMTNAKSIFVGKKPEAEPETDETESEPETETEKTTPSTEPSSGPSGPGDTPETEPQSDSTEKPESSAFDKNKKVSASAKTKTASRRVYFTWKKVAGADGYRIYQYNQKTGKYTSLVTVTGSETTSYKTNAIFTYGKSYTFKVRAYAFDSDGKTRIFGKYSAKLKVKIPPARVKKVSAVSDEKAQVELTWKRPARSQGYQIFRSTSKKGKYVRIKTIKKGGVLKYTDAKVKSGKTYYYKVCAYVVNSKGKRVYGKKSAVKKVIVK